MTIPTRIAIQQQAIDLSAETTALTRAIDSTDIGAVVTFTGHCRSEDDRLAALELEHYAGMAEAEIGRIATDAIARWPVLGLLAVHRVGRIAPGEIIVAVIAVSRHRQAAFDAAQFLMDFLKTRAPFWKKEHFADGSEGDWVDARASDDEAVTRWQATG